MKVVACELERCCEEAGLHGQPFTTFFLGGFAKLVKQPSPDFIGLIFVAYNQ